MTFDWQSILTGGGISLMIVGMGVVFCSLMILMFLLKGLKWSLVQLHKFNNRKKTGVPAAPTDEIPGVVVAAIAITLILEQEEIHDEESLVLTLRSLPKPYSNWWMKGLSGPWHSWRHKQGRMISSGQ
jgi:Na+-transporting methylmalonyl-CoA/oxaloacetate decarboxylase gamma subunit